MLPLRDINPVRRRPVVTVLLVAANVLAFLWVKSLPPLYEPAYGLVPARLLQDPMGEAFTVFTSMFMHANLAHLVGNLWFLWIFGDNVEDSLGHGRYLAFYLLGGVVAAAAQILPSLGSTIPMVGASGAIAAVTGAYLVLFPRAPILVMNPILPLWLLFGITFVVPAWVVVGEFLVVNLFMGLDAIGQPEAAKGGVAVFAHLGGFFMGLLTIRPLLRGKETQSHRAWDGWKPPGGDGSRGAARRGG